MKVEISIQLGEHWVECSIELIYSHLQQAIYRIDLLTTDIVNLQL